jgi:hypothetical protein
MAYKKISDDRYENNKKTIERLKAFNNPLNYSERVSLTILEAQNESMNAARERKNTLLSQVDVETDNYQKASNDFDDTLASMRAFMEAHKLDDSDLFVAAGGKRRSDITAQQQQTRLANLAAQEAEKKAKQAVNQTGTVNGA